MGKKKKEVIEKPVIKISVRNLVEFMLRSGDIDDSSSHRDQTLAMREGARIHKKIQKSMGASYRSEYPLKFKVTYDDYDLIIEGRADGIMAERTPALVDEIKGVYRDVEKMEAPDEVHLAQARCYAFMLLTERKLKDIEVQMTYVDLDTEAIRYFNETYRAEEIEDWFYKLVSAYKRWSDYEFYESRIVRESIRTLSFPFEMREGQKRLMNSVYRAITDEKLLFSQAPTGSGKTISTIYPGVKAMGEKKISKIFYLTAKTVTRTVAKDTFSLLNNRGYKGRTVEITAKDTICPLEKRECNPRSCIYAKGHFDRINDALYDYLYRYTLFDRETVLKGAEEYTVCPFEFSLDLCSFSDAIVCDYNYVFDPNVYLKRFFAEGVRGEYLFLVDEAHNLLDRGRSMYSETVSKEAVLSAKRWAKTVSKSLTKSLERINKLMLELKKQCTDYMILDEMDELFFAIENAAIGFNRLFEKVPNIDPPEDVLEFYFSLRNFVSLFDDVSKGYKIYTDFDREGDFRLHLFCVDPSAMLQRRFDSGRTGVLFSATLLPIRFYIDLLCCEDNPYTLYVDSPFPPENRTILIGRDVTSRYKKRNSDEYRKYAAYIKIITGGRKGNYMVFFPSYSFLSAVYDEYEISEDEELIKQDRNMREEERVSFLSAFEEKNDKTLIAFCVMGGIFSEGIDLTEDRLIGAIVVGTGLPQVSTETQIISSFFEERGDNGFSYAFLYPGMNKVMQAAGRVIRTMDDRGVIALLDDRFTESTYKNTFPREWSDHTVVTQEKTFDAVKSFWDK